MQNPPDAGIMPAPRLYGKIVRGEELANMAEPIEPENEPKTESAETDPTETEQVEEHIDAEDGHEDPDDGIGFTFEQRRFLWTLAGLNVVAVLLGAAIIVGYLASARSQDAAVVKLADQYKTADDDLQRAKQNEIPRIIDAELRGDKDAANELSEEVMEAYQAKASAYANWRRARGLDATDLTSDQLLAFSTELKQLVDQNVAAARRASTQPASHPAKQSATKP
jgi:hypothetical protein